MLPKIIGILGRSRVGKDTIADYIVSKYPEYSKVRLAKPVKDAVMALYGFTYDQLETDEKEVKDVRWGITPREAMVHVTQSTMEFMGNDFFTRRLYREYNGDFIIIPDVRYENDVKEINQRNGIVIKVTRKNNVSHGWEDAINNIKTDYEIVNEGSKEELYIKIDEILNNHLKI